MNIHAVFICTLLNYALLVHGLQCGSYQCPEENACCNDVVMGPTCYDPLDYGCVSNGANALRLCGENEGACGTACYDSINYYCCDGNIMQNGQSCVSATTAAPTSPTSPTATPTASPTAAPTIPAGYCPYVNNAEPALICPSGTTCCGADTMTPSCLPDDGSKQCCIWYLSATQCNASQVCGGLGGYGASSLAICGPPGTIFCNQEDAEDNTFCTPDELCCGSPGAYAYCCPSNTSTCDEYGYECLPIVPPTVPPMSCPYYGGAAHLVCDPGYICCGANTMTPSCMPGDGSTQCCEWYLSATQCNSTQVCGGDNGPGASSLAVCGPAGTTFCNQGFGDNDFCGSNEICCGSQDAYAFCCPAGSTCNNDEYTCS